MRRRYCARQLGPVSENDGESDSLASDAPSEPGDDLPGDENDKEDASHEEQPSQGGLAVTQVEGESEAKRRKLAL